MIPAQATLDSNRPRLAWSVASVGLRQSPLLGETANVKRPGRGQSALRRQWWTDELLVKPDSYLCKCFLVKELFAGGR